MLQSYTFFSHPLPNLPSSSSSLVYISTGLTLPPSTSPSKKSCLYSTSLTLPISTSPSSLVYIQPLLLCPPLLLLLVMFIFNLSYSAHLYFSFQSCLYSTSLSLPTSTSPSSHVYILPLLHCPPLLLLLVLFIFFLSYSAHLYFSFQSCLYSTCLSLTHCRN